MRRGQIGDGGENVRQSTDGEGHTLTKKIREILDVGDCEISASAAGEADSLIEVENVLEREDGR